MAQAKTEEGAAKEATAEAKPRRRITKRKAVEEQVRSYFDALGRQVDEHHLVRPVGDRGDGGALAGGRRQ